MDRLSVVENLYGHIAYEYDEANVFTVWPPNLGE